MEPTVSDPRPTEAPRRLARPRDDRVIAGVCSGIGRYFGVDPVLVRVATVVLVLLAGTGLLAYLIAWIVMPEDDASIGPPPTAPAASGDQARGAKVFGLVLIGVGVLLLLDRVFPLLSWRYVGPAVLILIGVAIFANGARR